MKKLIAEAIGTFGLVLIGTGSIVFDQQFDGLLGNIGIATSFGVAVFAMILSTASTSGAHLNPAVTLGLYFAGKIDVRQVTLYIAAQIVGAILASLMIAVAFGTIHSFGVTQPSAGIVSALLFEVVSTGVLVYIVMKISQKKSKSLLSVAALVGCYIFIAAAIGGPISGASLNPARSVGPALISGNFNHLWIYLIAPIVGSLVATLFCRRVHGEECCANCTVIRESTS